MQGQLTAEIRSNTGPDQKIQRSEFYCFAAVWMSDALGIVPNCQNSILEWFRPQNRMDGYKEESSSSQDRQSNPTVHEVGEGSSQAEEGFPHAAFSITGTASPGTLFGGMQSMVPNPMYANIGLHLGFQGTQGQFGVSQGNLGMAGFSIPPVNMTPRHQHVTGQGGSTDGSHSQKEARIIGISAQLAAEGNCKRKPLVLGDFVRINFGVVMLPKFSQTDVMLLDTERYKILSQLSRFNARETVPESKVEVMKKLDHLGGMGTSEAIVLLASSSHVEAGCTIETNNSVQGLSMKMRKSSRRKQVENQDSCMLRGVYYKNMKWQAAIKVEKKQIHLGTVATMEEAAHLYDRAAYLCGRVPNFELSEEEKQELQGLQWEEFLSMTKEAIASKKKRKRIETCIRRRHTSAPGEEGEIDRQPFYQMESESLHQPVPCDGHASFHHVTTFPETLPFYCTTSFHPTGAVLHSQ
ncbi:hypothetical protein L7F22_059081 [Adiantum nelumboides]|nr:hypothetical protein [Adiantum nelumboides]